MVQPGVPSNWSALIDRHESVGAERLARLVVVAGELRELTDGKELARGLAAPTWDVAQTLVLCGPERAQEELAPLDGLHEAAEELLYDLGPSIHYEETAVLLVHTNTLLCMGVPTPMDSVGELRMFDRLTRYARFLSEETRRVLGFAACALGRPEVVPTLVAGGPLASFEKGRVHGFATTELVRYLATAMMTDASFEDVQPAWEDFLRHAPHKLGAETLGYFDLLYAARALRVRFERSPVESVGGSLHARVTGHADDARPAVVPPREGALAAGVSATVARAWAPHFEKLARRRPDLSKLLEDAAGACASGPMPDKFRSLSTRLASWGLGLGDDVVGHVLHVSDAAVPELLDDIDGDPVERSFEDYPDLLAYVGLSRSFGGCPEGVGDDFEAERLAAVAPFAGKLRPGDRRELAILAAAAGAPDLVERFSGAELPASIDPGRRFENDVDGFVRSLAVAAGDPGTNRERLEAGWLTFLETALQRIDRKQVTAVEVVLVARVWFTRVSGYPVGETLQRLRAALGG